MLQNEFPNELAYFAFVSHDEETLVSGDSIKEAAAYLDTVDQVVMLGVNCVRPENANGLIKLIRSATNKPIVVYPNSGEKYDGSTRKWVETEKHVDIP